MWDDEVHTLERRFKKRMRGKPRHFFLVLFFSGFYFFLEGEGERKCELRVEFSTGVFGAAGPAGGLSLKGDCAGEGGVANRAVVEVFAFEGSLGEGDGMVEIFPWDAEI